LEKKLFVFPDFLKKFVFFPRPLQFPSDDRRRHKGPSKDQPQGASFKIGLYSGFSSQKRKVGADVKKHKVRNSERVEKKTVWNSPAGADKKKGKKSEKELMSVCVHSGTIDVCSNRFVYSSCGTNINIVLALPRRMTVLQIGVQFGREFGAGQVIFLREEGKGQCGFKKEIGKSKQMGKQKGKTPESMCRKD